MSRFQQARVGVMGAAAIAGALPLIAHFEGLRNDPYWDVAHIRTVCYGETKGVQERRYETAECKALLEESVARHAAELRPFIPANTPLMVQIAFLSVGYNIGAKNFGGSTMARRLKAGDLAGACAAISMWNKARNPLTGKLEVRAGLTNRRDAERAVCEQGLTP